MLLKTLSAWTKIMSRMAKSVWASATVWNGSVNVPVNAGPVA